MVAARLRYNMRGYYRLRSEPGVRGALEAEGRSVAARASSMTPKARGGKLRNPPYVVASYQGKRNPQGRWQVKVITGNPHSARHNAKYNTLLRALGGS